MTMKKTTEEHEPIEKFMQWLKKPTIIDVSKVK
jgi:hypothetical protein